MLGSKALIALARALDVSEDYLLADDDITLEGVEFRKKAIAASNAEARVKAKLLPHLERYLAVEELLGLPSVNWDQPRGAPYPVAAEVLEADRAARNLRNAWGLGTDPIPNVVELLEERGIKVLMIDVDDIDGLTARVSRRGHPAAPVVGVNSSHTGEIQRVTIAQQLAHLVLEVSPKLDKERVTYRFAGAFLMPAEKLRSEVGNVPPYAEQRPLPAEKPTRFERLCLRALAEDVISESRAAELLGTSVRELDRRMEMPTVSAR